MSYLPGAANYLTENSHKFEQPIENLNDFWLSLDLLCLAHTEIIVRGNNYI